MSDQGSEMADLVIDDCKDKMRKAIDHLKGEFAGVRTGRANSSLVDKLKVEAYGSEVPLQQIAGFSVPEPRVLVINPYDKTTIKAIERAIQGSDLGITPNNDGTLIRLVFPELTGERRKDLVKVVKHRAEEGRVAVRNVRRQARHDLEALAKDGDLSDDDLKRSEDTLEKHTKTVVAEVDSLLTHKERELLED
ncbi:MAG TPA: ribosome recycling factor [Acidimicrobiia bacterium]|nr:ribosome recycling factor [Acidimicrobiia bacterium]